MFVCTCAPENVDMHVCVHIYARLVDCMSWSYELYKSYWFKDLGFEQLCACIQGVNVSVHRGCE